MADFTNNKPLENGNYPQNVNTLSGDGAAGFTRVEPFLTPERLRAEFLFGIPLYSPLTRQPVTDETLKSLIRRAAADVELETKIQLTSTVVNKRIDFDKVKYLQGWNQLDTGFVNITRILEVSIRTINSTMYPSNYPTQPGSEEGDVLYNMPLEWIDTSYAHKGILHFVPLQSTFTGTGIVNAGTASNTPSIAWTAVLARLQWIPSFWFVRLAIGYEDNAIPAPINELIGLYAAKRVLSMLGPTNKFSSQSIGIDGASQSVGNAGVQWFAQRIKEIDEEAAKLLSVIKARFGQKIFMTHM